MKIANSLTELIGKTPLLRLNNYEKNNKIEANIIAKVEFFNPMSSIKDRVALSMIDDGMANGKINKDTVIIEPTSGNTGIGLAMVTAARGLKLILTMPDTMSIERRLIVSALGAEVVLTPGEEGMQGSINEAKRLAKKYGNAFIPQQFENSANPLVHKVKTAQEIWQDTAGKVDIFIAGVGTGGTISGVGEALKEKNPNVKIIAVEPKGSAVLAGGSPGVHNLQGIGTGFIPAVMNMEIIDEVIGVEDDEAYIAAREVAKTEGLLVGISSGAVLHAATVISARKENKGKNIVVLLPDSGERYLSTVLFK